MSTASPPENTAAPPAGDSSTRLPGSRPGRRTATTLAAAVLVAAVVVVLVLSDELHPTRRSSVLDNGSPTSLARVARGRLSEQINQNGTLSYAASADGAPYQVINQASGTLSALPATGRVIKQGQVLYRASDAPVVLLTGSTPAYRSLSEGDSGPDVRELNRDLIALGYAKRSELESSSDYFGPETAYALERLQDKLGVDETGSLTLGQVVFAPAPLRISKVLATLGTAAQPGTPVLQATSTARQVVVNLDASQQASVKVGDRAQVTLPDDTTTPGRVTAIGTTATPGSDSSGSTIRVYITLDHPRAAGTLDDAPVQVQITTGGVKDALIVPVSALLALAGGGYAVETVQGRAHRLVAVTLGAFDDADGLVQVSGALNDGERIVVPTT